MGRKETKQRRIRERNKTKSVQPFGKGLFVSLHKVLKTLTNCMRTMPLFLFSLGQVQARMRVWMGGGGSGVHY